MQRNSDDHVDKLLCSDWRTDVNNVITAWNGSFHWTSNTNCHNLQIEVRLPMDRDVIVEFDDVHLKVRFFFLKNVKGIDNP